MTLSPRRVEQLLADHGIEPRRGLGQNFVADPNTVRRIVRLAEVGPRSRVVEVGPGLGSLTLALAESGARVLAVEADERLVPVLTSVLADAGAGGRVRVVHADALVADWGDLLTGDGWDDDATPGHPTVDDAHRTSSVDDWVLVANLPYNVAATVVVHLLDHVPAIGRMLVMVQREVGERLAASPGTRTWGIPSVKVSYHAVARVVAAVPRSVFVPRPRVDSVLVEVRRRPHPATEAPADPLFGLVRTAFNQRRKMLRRSLAGLVAPEVFEQAGVAATRRPEQLDVGEWGRLTTAWLAAGGPATAPDVGRR